MKPLLPAVSIFFFFNLLLVNCITLALALDPPSPAACHSTCGSIQLKYPFGTAPGCGSPTFQPYISCIITNQYNHRDHNKEDVLLLTTHTSSYPITSISYSSQTLTLTPPSMSTCASMQPSPSNLGLDWASPFQLGPSTFILLSCQPPTPTPICDPSYSYLCASIYTCPAVIGLGLPMLAPTNTCCVYSPGNLDAKGELDLGGLKCGGYTSVVSVGEYPTEPAKWEYGVALKYNSHGGGLDGGGGIVGTKCKSCEMSGGVCGYKVDDISFLCVCKNGYNTSLDCYNNNTPDFGLVWSPASSSNLPPPLAPVPASKLLFVLVAAGLMTITA